MKGNVCANCKWFRGHSASQASFINLARSIDPDYEIGKPVPSGLDFDLVIFGDCHRFPAGAKVSGTDWCAEFSAKDVSA